MSRTESLELLNSLITGLTPLGEMTPGRPLRASEWNNLVGAIRMMANLAVARERTTDDFLDDRYAPVTHQHIGEIGLEWFEPGTRALIERNVNGSVEQNANLKAVRDEIAQVRTALDDLRRQVSTLRGDLDGLRDSDTARIKDIDRVAVRVELLRNVEGRVGGLDQRLGAMSTDLQAALAFRNELRDPAGNPIDVRGMGERLTGLEGLRDNLRKADGQIVQIREIESAVARLEERTIDRSKLDEALIGRLRDPATVAQTGLVETVRGQVENALGQRLNGIDTAAGQLRQDVTGIRETIATQDTRLGQHDTRLGTAEGQLTTLPAVSTRVDQQQSQLTAMDGRLQVVQTSMSDLPDLRRRVGKLRVDLDDLTRVGPRVTDLDTRLQNIELRGPTIDGLVTSTQNASTRLTAIEQGLPTLRQAADLTNTNAALIGTLESRLQVAEAELDNTGDIGARLSGVDRLVGTLTEQQTATTRRLDELNTRTGGIDTIHNRLASVESAAAEHRNSIARLNDSVSSTTRLIDSRLRRIETRIPIQ
jgi:chromosome segregation ATPase